MRKPNTRPTMFAMLVSLLLAGPHWLVSCGGGGGDQAQPAPVPPSISGFTASATRIVKGGSLTLTPTFSNGSGTITPGSLTVQSGVAISVNPTQSTEYTLTVTGAGSPVTAKVKVGVEAFSPVGNMTAERMRPAVVVLPNGKVLVAGGIGSDPLSADLYDPATRVFTRTASLATMSARSQGALVGNGKVLVVELGKRAELYDPATGLWSATGSPSADRFNLTLTRLDSGKALLSHGTTNMNSMEVFDPQTGTFEAPIPTPYAIGGGHDAVKLADGKVLLVGGHITPVIYDPAANTLQPFAASMATQRTFNRSVRLADGKVLVTGGLGLSIEPLLIDPAAGTITPGPALLCNRWGHAAVVLPSGRVLILGGTVAGAPSAHAEIYDPATGTSRVTDGMGTPRTLPVAVLLADGKVLVIGGTSDPNANSGGIATAEIFDPGE